MSFDSPLDQEFLDTLYTSQREVIGDDLARPVTYIIGRVLPNGVTETVVTLGDYGRVWIRLPGADTGDAIQAINRGLQPHELGFNRPVSVKKQGGKYYIIDIAPESAEYAANEPPPRPQTVINRSQYDSALLRPTVPESMVAVISGGYYRVGRELYRVKPQQTQDFTSLIPVSDALAYTVTLDPLTEALTYTASASFTVKPIQQAFDDGDIDPVASDIHTVILGYILLYAGQTVISRDDILIGEQFLRTGKDYGFVDPVDQSTTIHEGMTVTHAGALHIDDTLHIDGVLHILDDGQDEYIPNARIDIGYTEDARIRKKTYQISPIQIIAPEQQIDPTASHIRVRSPAGLIELSSNPQILPGIDGQELTLEGSSDVNRICFVDGNGLHLHGGEVVLGLYDSVTLVYNKAAGLWVEKSRNLPPTEVPFSFTSPTGVGGTSYVGGFYKFGSTNSNFTAPVNFGSANNPYGAHPFVVLGETAVDDITIQVSGLGIFEDGSAPAITNQNFIIPSGSTINSYFEIEQKYAGTITFTHISGTAKQCNYGYAKYWDNNNSDFMVTGFDGTWTWGANDNNPEIILRHHRSIGWIYNAGAPPTPPPGIAVYSLTYGVAKTAVNGQPASFKRSGMTSIVYGGTNEGTIIEISQTVGKVFESGNFVLRITPR